MSNRHKGISFSWHTHLNRKHTPSLVPLAVFSVPKGAKEHTLKTTQLRKRLDPQGWATQEQVTFPLEE